MAGVYLSGRNTRIRNERENLARREKEIQNQRILEAEKLAAIEASSREERISPGAIIRMRKIYQDCGHALESEEKVSDEFVNLTKEEFRNKNPDLEIIEFSSNKIIAMRSISDFCRQHFRIREQEGRIAIYELDARGNEVGLLRVTNIWTRFLPETDMIFIGEGKDVFSEVELNKVLQDFDEWYEKGVKYIGKLYVKRVKIHKRRLTYV